MLEHTLIIPNATAKQVYDALLSSEQHTKVIGDTAEITDKVGERFSTFSGYAEGENLELVPAEKIVQTWRASDWPEDHYSTITFELADADDGVKIHFTQENLPPGTMEEFDAGWQDNYWSRLEEFFQE